MPTFAPGGEQGRDRPLGRDAPKRFVPSSPKMHWCPRAVKFCAGRWGGFVGCCSVPGLRRVASVLGLRRTRISGNLLGAMGLEVDVVELDERAMVPAGTGCGGCAGSRVCLGFGGTAGSGDASGAAGAGALGCGCRRQTTKAQRFQGPCKRLTASSPSFRGQPPIPRRRVAYSGLLRARAVRFPGRLWWRA